MNEKEEIAYIGDGIYVHNEGYRIALAVNSKNNKVIYMEEAEILALIKCSKRMGIIK